MISFVLISYDGHGLERTWSDELSLGLTDSAVSRHGFPNQSDPALKLLH